MPLTVSLELSDQELEHFRTVLRSARTKAARRQPHEIAAAASAAVEKLRSAAHSPFVAKRLQKVDALVRMLDDPEWRLPHAERCRVLDGLAYVAEIHDLVPDDVPVLGLVDDAIMLELVLRELQHELESYGEFDDYRRQEHLEVGAATHVSRQDWLDARRQALHERMRERRERDLDLRGGGLSLITHF
ncbi:MAG TPA: YkvA family protein [Steroidobacteraceae bacterium]|nr:YkvA family protein [Steroidobacteraceae bacterium]